MKKFSALELLHPDGIARAALVLGSNCPDVLHPNLQERFDGKADLFILAPSGKEAKSQVWLEAAAQALSDDLSADGIGYVLVSPRWRRRVMDLLRAAGLVSDTAFWHFPDLSSSRYLTPIERFPGQFVVDTILAAPSFKRTLAMFMFRFWGTRQLLIHFWQPVGLTVRRPNARPLFQWLQGEQRSLPGTALIRRSWRGEMGANISYGFLGHDAFPAVIAKTIAVEKASTLNREAQVLERVVFEARRAGVQLPKVIGWQQNDQHSSLLLSFVPGRSISDLLAVQPDRFGPMLTRIVDWLDHWHRATLNLQRFTSEQFEQNFLSPLNQLAPVLQNVEQYRSWLLKQSEKIVGNPVPRVATHNDLTMANILVDERDQFGVVDWETGSCESLPFVDFYYALTDAVRITAHYTDWLSSFRACYRPEGSYFAQAIAWREQLELAVGASAGFAKLCFHACWLHHAFNEQQGSQPGEPHPFLEIMQWLALHESNFNDN